MFIYLNPRSGWTEPLLVLTHAPHSRLYYIVSSPFIHISAAPAFKTQSISQLLQSILDLWPPSHIRSPFPESDSIWSDHSNTASYPLPSDATSLREGFASSSLMCHTTLSNYVDSHHCTILVEWIFLKENRYSGSLKTRHRIGLGTTGNKSTIIKCGFFPEMQLPHVPK